MPAANSRARSAFDREADDLGDARPAARSSQLVAALGQPSADERAERGVEPARAHGGAQVAELSRGVSSSNA